MKSEIAILDFVQRRFGAPGEEWKVVGAEDAAKEITPALGVKVNTYDAFYRTLNGKNGIFFTLYELDFSFDTRLGKSENEILPSLRGKKHTTKNFELWATTHEPKFDVEPPVPWYGRKFFTFKWKRRGDETDFSLDDASFGYVHPGASHHPEPSVAAIQVFKSVLTNFLAGTLG